MMKMTMNSNPKEVAFLNALRNRIALLRDTIEINSQKQIKGKRFNDTEYVIEGVQGAVLAQNDPEVNALGLNYAKGLSFDNIQVISGNYDKLIKMILIELAKMDFEFETSIDLH